MKLFNLTGSLWLGLMCRQCIGRDAELLLCHDKLSVGGGLYAQQASSDKGQTNERPAPSEIVRSKSEGRCKWISILYFTQFLCAACDQVERTCWSTLNARTITDYNLCVHLKWMRERERETRL